MQHDNCPGCHAPITLRPGSGTRYATDGQTPHICSPQADHRRDARAPKPAAFVDQMDEAVGLAPKRPSRSRPAPPAKLGEFRDHMVELVDRAEEEDEDAREDVAQISAPPRGSFRDPLTGDVY